MMVKYFKIWKLSTKETLGFIFGKEILFSLILLLTGCLIVELDLADSYFMKAFYSLCLYILTRLAIFMLAPCWLEACTTTFGMHCIDCWVQTPSKGTRTRCSWFLECWKGLLINDKLGSLLPLYLMLASGLPEVCTTKLRHRWKSVSPPSWWLQ